MKGIILSSLLAFVMLTAFQCNKNKVLQGCYKGKLEKKGICMNYTISVIDGNIDPSLVEASWTDPNTNITYTNAFGLDSPCGFPSDLVEGQEFYFTIDPDPNTECAVCMAYYPTPEKKLAIKVLNEPCP